MCDNKGPTLTLIKTVAGHTFGGFTTISWDSSGSWKNDTQSFLFSVDKQTKYPIVNSYGNAIFCGSSYGPTFGNGHTIYVSDNSNSNSNSHVSNGNAYNILAGANGKPSILTDGNQNFQTTEIEVYLVQWTDAKQHTNYSSIFNEGASTLKGWNLEHLEQKI